MLQRRSKFFINRKDLDILDTLDIPLYHNLDVDDVNDVTHSGTASDELELPVEFTATKAHCLDVIIVSHSGGRDDNARCDKHLLMYSTSCAIRIILGVVQFVG